LVIKKKDTTNSTNITTDLYLSFVVLSHAYLLLIFLFVAQRGG